MAQIQRMGDLEGQALEPRGVHAGMRQGHRRQHAEPRNRDHRSWEDQAGFVEDEIRCTSKAEKVETADRRFNDARYGAELREGGGVEGNVDVFTEIEDELLAIVAKKGVWAGFNPVPDT